MIMTILKQTTRYYLEEKEYEVANVYGNLYAETALNYSQNQKKCATALTDLAHDFFISEQYRSAKSHYQEVIRHFGEKSLSEKGLFNLALCELRLHHSDEALKWFQKLVRTYPYSSFVRETFKYMSQICDDCFNRKQAEIFRELSSVDIHFN